MASGETKEWRSEQGLGWTRVDLPSLEFDDHDDGPYCADDDDEWPQELADAYPDVRPLLTYRPRYQFGSPHTHKIQRRKIPPRNTRNRVKEGVYAHATYVRQCEDGKGCRDRYADPNTSVDLPGKTRGKS